MQAVQIIKWLGIVTVDVVFSVQLMLLEETLVFRYGHSPTPGMYIAQWLSPPTLLDNLLVMSGVDFFLWFVVVGAICIALMRYQEKRKSISAVAEGRSEHDAVDLKR
jgi:hypothetical protein